MNIEIPCNVGDYVYKLNKSQKKIETKKISQINVHIGRDSLAIHMEFEIYGFCTLRDLGNTVFINRADALRKLEEIK